MRKNRDPLTERSRTFQSVANQICPKNLPKSLGRDASDPRNGGQVSAISLFFNLGSQVPAIPQDPQVESEAVASLGYRPTASRHLLPRARAIARPLPSQMGSTCSTASAVPPGWKVEAVKRAVFSPLPAKIGLETDLQGPDITLTRRGGSGSRRAGVDGSGSFARSSGDSSSQASSSATLHARHRQHSIRRFRSADLVVESNPKARLDTFVRRICSNPAPSQGLALFRGGAEAVIRPAGCRGLTQAATAPSRPATLGNSGSGRVGLRALPARRDSTSSRSRGSTPERPSSRGATAERQTSRDSSPERPSSRDRSPERLASRDSSGSRASLSGTGGSRASLQLSAGSCKAVRSKDAGSFFRPLAPEKAFQPAAMAHRRSTHVSVRRTSISDLTRQA